MPTTHPSISFGAGSTSVHSTGKKVLLIQPSSTDPSFTDLQQITEISLEAFLVPTKVMRHEFIGHQARYLAALRRRFVNSRTLKAFDEHDARDLGEELINAVVVVAAGGGGTTTTTDQRESENANTMARGAKHRDGSTRESGADQRKSARETRGAERSAKKKSSERSTKKVSPSPHNPPPADLTPDTTPPAISRAATAIKTMLTSGGVRRLSGAAAGDAETPSGRGSRPVSFVRMFGAHAANLGGREVRHEPNKLLTDFIDANEALGEFAAEHPWVEYLIAAIVDNRLTNPKQCDLSLETLDVEDDEKGAVIGGALPFFLASMKDIPLAVSQWASMYPALGEVSSTYPWFETFIVALVVELDSVKNGNKMVDIRLFERQEFGLMNASQGDLSFSTIQNNLGNAHGSSTMFSVILLSYLVNAFILSVKVSSPFTGVSNNTIYIL